MRRLLALVALLALAACAAPPRGDTTGPVLKLEAFFPGRVIARGTFEPAFGGAPRGLTVTIDSTWDGQVLTLAEDFAYDDGERDFKTWRLTQTGDRRFSGTREDVIGTAAAYPEGSAMRLDYYVVLKTEAYGDLTVRFRDIMLLEADGTLVNRAVVSKWGLRLGRVELRMTREAAVPKAAGAR